MPTLTGYSATLPADVLLDSGILMVGSTKIGVSDGGLTFDPGITEDEVMFDGKRTPIKGLRRRLNYEATISGTLIELGDTVTAYIEPGAVAVGTTTKVFTPIDAGVLMTGGYISALRLVFEKGTGGLCCVLFATALVRKYSIKTQDKGSGKIDVEFLAVRDMTTGAVQDCPYEIVNPLAALP